MGVFEQMKRYLLVVAFGVLVFLIYQTSVFSSDELLQKELVEDVNNYALDKLSLSLEEISLLFSYKRRTYIGAEVIEEYLDRDHMSKLLEDGYLTLENAPNLGDDIPGGGELYYFALTEKSRIIIE